MPSSLNSQTKEKIVSKLESLLTFQPLLSFFFLVSILFQVLYARHHKREKRFGPSPANGYTYGTQGRSLFRRNKKNNPETASGDDILPGHPSPQDVELGTPEEKPGLLGRMFSRKKTAANPAAPTTGYGYGNSAYTANY